MKNDRNGRGIFFRILAGLTVGLGIFSGTLYAAENARAVIGSESIIEALTPKPQPKTRSLRNLRVEPVPPPSVSLTIAFEFDSAALSAESTSQLTELSAALSSDDLRTLRFLIEGHTDAKGRPSYNLTLSQRRAAAVKDFLVSQGVDQTQLAAEGRGASDLANPAEPLSAVNRRVKIVTMVAR